MASATKQNALRDWHLAWASPRLLPVSVQVDLCGGPNAGHDTSGQRLLASARRVATVPATPSDLLGPRAGRVWRFRTLDVPLVALKAAGAAGGGSVNDAYLAGLLGGLARYHDAMGAPITDLPVAVPVSLRRPDDPHGGNRFTAVQIAGPASIAGPLERIAAIRAQILSARVEPALGLIGLAAPAVLSRLPADLAHAARGRMGLQADLSAPHPKPPCC